MSGVVHVVDVEVTFRLAVKLAGSGFMDAEAALARLLADHPNLMPEMLEPILNGLKDGLGVDWQEPGAIRVVPVGSRVALPEVAPIAMDLSVDYEPRKKSQ